MSRTTETAARMLSLGRRETGGPLQQARATSVVWWSLALGLCIALFMSPVVLGLILGATIVVARRSGVLREVMLALAISMPLAIGIALINPIASQQGVTVLIAGVHLPLVGTFDVTSEALIYGLILGLRTSALFALCALYVCCVSPDELLRVLRRHSVRSAITASLSVRFVPMLARDGANLAAARACRPGMPPSNATIVRAAFARSLERAGDSALALETRGFALARPLKTAPPPRRAADWVLLVSALLVAMLSIAGQVVGLCAMTPYPTTSIAFGPTDIAFALLIALCASLPALVASEGER